MTIGIIPPNPFSNYGEDVLGNMPDYDSGPELFKRILSDWYPELVKTNPRSVVLKEIKKVIRCKRTHDGYMYSCPNCDKVRFVGFTCGSLFCPSCGNLYNQQRANSMAEHLVNVPHRHVIFTISDVLRPLFLEDRNLLKFLFEAASETFSEVINRNWKGHLNVGMVVVCHTFSRSSEWNPHVHCICTEGGFTDWGVWYHRPFIKYEDLRLTFMEHLLVKLRKNVKDPASFAAIEAEIRGAQKKGFFVYAPPPPQKFAGDLKQLVKYTARYLGRPCIATSRIDSYDGQVVKFHYWAHTENGEQLKHEVLTGLEFVQRLAQHIQEPNFKKVRFYGIYASHGKGVDALHLALERPALNHQNPIAFLYPPEKHAMRQSFCHFRGAMFHAFGVDPLVCPECHVEMTLDFCVYKGHIFMHPPTLRHAPCPPPQMTG